MALLNHLDQINLSAKSIGELECAHMVSLNASHTDK